LFKLYSKGCEYALRALTYAATQNEDGRFQAADVCLQTGIPESFSRKIFQALVQGGFLRALRGPGGGYVLTIPPDQISLLDVIRAVEGDDTFDHCVLGLPECGTKRPCPLHETWVKAKEQLLAQLEKRTLQDLADASQPKRRPSHKLAGR
jgi:Rrf2 family protein